MDCGERVCPPVMLFVNRRVIEEGTRDGGVPRMGWQGGRFDRWRRQLCWMAKVTLSVRCVIAVGIHYVWFRSIGCYSDERNKEGRRKSGWSES